MVSNIDMELYRIFYTVAETGSISKAAEKLFVSQPAVSQSIKHLEESLGCPLFIRNPRGVSLTENAAALYREIEKAFYIFDHAEKSFISRANRTEGELRINATEILIRYALLPYMHQYAKEFPNVKIKLTSRGTLDAINDIKNGKIHIAAATMPAPQVGNLTTRRLFSFHDCFVAGEEYEFMARKENSIGDVLKYPVMVLREGMNSRLYFDKICHTYGYSVDPYMETESIDTLIQCTVCNMGAAFVIREFAEKELAEKKLFVIPVSENIEERHIGIVTLDNDLPDYGKFFIEGLMETFR